MKKRYFAFDKNLNLKQENINEEKKYPKNINYFALAKFSSFGYYLIVPIILGIFIGFLLDNLLKTKKIFFIMGFLIGIFGTFYNLKKIYTEIKNDN
ncbi:MAG: AtpZ/AtpI family protein [Microgenomates group bacterium]